MSEVFDAKSVVINNDNVTVVKLKSNRDTDIHTSIMMPEIADGEKCPLVLILHGFLGDRNEYGKFYRFMLSKGVNIAPSQFEAMFVSDAHTDEDIEYISEQIELICSFISLSVYITFGFDLLYSK